MRDYQYTGAKKLFERIMLGGIMLAMMAGAARAEDFSALAGAQIGEIVTFGACEQDNDPSNGAEPIEWRVLENTGDTILLNAVYALECKAYHSNSDATTWETCDLRAWLNGEFYEQNFSEVEKAIMALSRLENPSSERYDVSGGNPTEDYVYILSTQEQKLYYASEEAMTAPPTPYALSKGAATSPGNEDQAFYWLRNPGMTDMSAALFYGNFLNYAGIAYANVKEYEIAIRPVIRLNLGALN